MEFLCGRNIISFLCMLVVVEQEIKGSPIVRITTCLNGGTLLIDVTGNTCECISDFGGIRCEKPIKGDIWIPPSELNWNGPNSTAYWSFDSLDNVIVLIGLQRSGFNEFNVSAAGQINSAVSTNSSMMLTINLGFHQEACMTQITCGSAGGAVSFWMRVINPTNCQGLAGIITTQRNFFSTGFRIVCRGPSNIEYIIGAPGGEFLVFGPKSQGWVHVVMNYTGPNSGEGFQVFNNGGKVGSTTSLTSLNLAPLELGNGQIVIGAHFTTFTIFLSDVIVDELLFLEGALNMGEITALYNYGFNFGQNGN